jgi:hypothetical protein
MQMPAAWRRWIVAQVEPDMRGDSEAFGLQRTHQGPLRHRVHAADCAGQHQKQHYDYGQNRGSHRAPPTVHGLLAFFMGQDLGS